MFRQRRKTNIETDCITPKTTQPDIEHETSNLDYATDDLYDMRNLKHSTLNDNELNTRIKYLVSMNGKVIHMISNKIVVCNYYLKERIYICINRRNENGDACSKSFYR